MAIEAMKNAWSDSAVQEMIEARLKARLDDANRIKRAWRSGKAEGVEEGRAEGVEEGRAEGVEEGVKKGMRVAAEKMLAEGIDRKTVARALGIGENDLP